MVTVEHHQVAAGRSRWIPVAAAGTVVLVSALVLVGWALDVTVLTSVLPGYTSMKVNTALCFLLLGSAAAVALLDGRRGTGRSGLPARWGWSGWAGWAAGAVVAVTALTLVEYLAGVDLGIDELLVTDSGSVGNNPPGRMAPTSAIALLFSGLALLAGWRGWWRGTGWLLVVPALLGGVAILGYAYDVEQLYAVAAFATMAVHTSVLLVLTALAVGALVPGGLVTWLLADRGPGAALVRRLAPVALGFFPLLGFVRLRLGESGLFGERFGIALTVTLAAVAVLAVAVHTARRLDLAVERQDTAQAELRRVNQVLEERRDAEWRRAEELSRSLDRERELFSRSIAKLDDLVWTMEVAADGSMDLVYTSPNAEGLFGGALPEEMSSMFVAANQLIHPEDAARYEEFLARIARGGPSEAELRFVGFDGVTRWIWTRGMPRVEGERHFFDGISTNVTERRAIAEQREQLLALERQQVEALSESQQLRDEFVALAGHEMRTPMAAILGYAELLMDDPDLTAAQRTFLAIIERRSRDLTELVDDFFDLARLNSGITTLDLVRLDLRSVVEEAVEAQRLQVQEKGLEIDTELAPAWVDGDAGRLRQVVDNLLSNAVKFTPTGGHLRVSVTPNGREVVVAVADDGIGISEEQLPYIFDHLFRAATAKQHGIPGTGLGLSITKALVLAHGGQIVAESRPGGGSRFVITLPLAGPGTGSGTGSGTASPSGGTENARPVLGST
ncbi:sensor histidine kinase [Nocardioides donggukensis]|uniref:histidine kinase n=1 Tax=Nocardioides donggukensis TaxID=2774019 RepID=A0A927Q0I3_9ACTN|nr:PAS domain-containing sensor histidine kinase [Nocardioides donggukensis]MBD8868967.1 PAS domain-containing sensor histidine kinase [Nocardioides donggukensis]